MSQVTITLNGKKLLADSNKTILEVARKEGISIPTLCHDDRLEPYGSCRVCLVKVKGARTYLPSCSTKVMDGMIIDTEAEDVKNARKMSLSLLISDHFGDCVSPCSQKCPANIDIQGYIALIANRKYQEAVKLIKEKLPMPLSIGRICPHPCESVCRRNKVEEPIAINSLKRFAADYDISTGNPYIPQKEPPKGKKIAVIGSGPAGLSAAYFLAVKGYEVTIFERNEKAGGMLRYGIPEYRLPKDILDREIDLILSLGINIEYSKELGKDITIEDLKNQGYSAVFMGLGAQKSMDMRVEGENIEGVESGIGFLHKVAEKQEISDISGKKVIVVGGGNTAMDAARTSLRLGASEVIILYRRTKKEMPANDYEIEEAEEEGVLFKFLAAPIKIQKENSKLKVECINMKLGESDASGRRRPIPIKGSNYIEDCDLLIKAIGQRPDLSSILDEKLVSERDRLKADPETGVTPDPFIFGGGDCVIGAATAVEAIAAGRKAAYSIDQYLMTGKIDKYTKEFIISKGKLEEIPDEFFKVYEKSQRVKMSTNKVGERIHDFREIELGLTEDQALKEAARCLECGCNEGFTCKLREHSTEYNVKKDDFEGAVNHFPEYNNMTSNHPVILREQNKCIKCGICVRYCDEIRGLGVFGFVKRGFETEISPYFYHELADTSCDFCGGCADACPTGALSINPFTPKPGPFKTEKIEGSCIQCSIGCRLEYNVYDNMLVRNRAAEVDGENEGSLCIRGRFGFLYLTNNKRSIEYCEFNKNKKTPLTQKEALSKTASILKNAKNPAIITSTNLSNEEYEKLYKLSNTLGKIPLFHIAHDFAEKSTSPYKLVGKSLITKSIIDTLKYPTLLDIEQSDCIILFNIQPGRHYPILENKLRKAARKGRRLFIINNSPLRLESEAESVFRINDRYYTEFFDLLGFLIYKNSSNQDETTKSYYKDLTINKSIPSSIRIKEEKIKELARAIQQAGTLSFICDEGETDITSLMSFAQLARLSKNAFFLPMLKGANPMGGLKYMKHPPKNFTLTQSKLASFDTLFLYKTPAINIMSHQNVLHIGFSPYKKYGENAIFLPALELIETGGTRFLYNGKQEKISTILKPPIRESNTEIIEHLNKIVRSPI